MTAIFRPASVAVSALAAILVLEGCGGQERLSKPGYEQEVRSLYANVQEAFRATAVGPTAELAVRVEKAQEALRKAADQLDEAAPPKEVEEENEEIVEGMRRYADDLDEVRGAAERGDQSAIDEFNQRISRNEAVEQIAEAAEEMKFKGYDLGPIAEE